MTTIHLNDELSQAVIEIAAEQNTTLEKLVNHAVMELLEDYQDAKAAETVIQSLEQGETQTIPWEQVKAGLYDLDD